MTRKEWDALWQKIDAHYAACCRPDCYWDHQQKMVERAVRKAYRGKK